MHKEKLSSLSATARPILMGLAILGTLTACTAEPLPALPVSAVDHFATNPAAAPASVKPGDRYFVHDGKGSETYELNLPAYTRSVTMFLACDANVNGTISVLAQRTVIAGVTLGGCGGEIWSSGNHDVDPAKLPDTVQVTVKQGVKWKATIYVSREPIPTDLR